MTFEIQIHSGSKTSEHRVELSTGANAGQGGSGVDKSAAGNPQTQPGQSLKAAAGNAAAQERCDHLLRFSSDGVTLVADGEEISDGVYSILIDGQSYEAHVSKRPGSAEGYLSSYAVIVGLRHYRVEIRDPRSWKRRETGVQDQGPQDIVAPMPGKIVKVLVAENQEVLRDQELLVIEAMKMQNVIRAPRAGRVGRIYAQVETGVEAGFHLLRLV
jgi:biotin carboxyl carrier protein